MRCWRDPKSTIRTSLPLQAKDPRADPASRDLGCLTSPLSCDLDSCDGYWDALGPELAAEGQEIATCTEASGGVIIHIDPHRPAVAVDEKWADGKNRTTTP